MKKENRRSRRDFVGTLALGAIGIALPKAGAARWLLNSRPDYSAPPVTGDRKYVPVMITPFRPDGKIDFDGLSRLIEFYTAAGAKGFFANCQSSEMYALSPDERLALTRHVVKQAGRDQSVVATGSFGDSLEQKAEFISKIHDCGVNGVITITGLMAKAGESDDVLIKNYEELFRLTGNIPLGTYECPAPYKRILTPRVFEFLVESGRLIYHKDTTIDLPRVKVKIELAKKNPQLEFYDACIANAMYSLKAGARGMSAICGNLYPEIVSWMCAHFNDPDKQEDVSFIQQQITQTEDILAKGYPLSSKYFLSRKRGLPIEVSSRLLATPLTTDQMQLLDGVHKTFLGWCERLSIKPVVV